MWSSIIVKCEIRTWNIAFDNWLLNNWKHLVYCLSDLSLLEGLQSISLHFSIMIFRQFNVYYRMLSSDCWLSLRLFIKVIVLHEVTARGGGSCTLGDTVTWKPFHSMKKFQFRKVFLTYSILYKYLNFLTSIHVFKIKLGTIYDCVVNSSSLWKPKTTGV